MTIAFAELILACVAAYFGVGVIVGVIFTFIAVSRLDHAARGAPLQFRLIILPGAIGLWPLVLIRLLSFRKINAPTD